MARRDNIFQLAPDLPLPQDDGACGYLSGMSLPSIGLDSAPGDRVDLSMLQERVVAYIYPRKGFFVPFFRRTRAPTTSSIG